MWAVLWCGVLCSGFIVHNPSCAVDCPLSEAKWIQEHNNSSTCTCEYGMSEMTRFVEKKKDAVCCYDLGIGVHSMWVRVGSMGSAQKNPFAWKQRTQDGANLGQQTEPNWRNTMMRTVIASNSFLDCICNYEGRSVGSDAT